MLVERLIVDQCHMSSISAIFMGW